MDLKDKTRKELEDIIAEKGVGAEYVKKVERVQRDVNLALMLGTATALLGLTAWTIYKFKGE